MKSIFLKFIFIAILLPQVAKGGLKLNISLVLKRGVDKGLVLVNELHSIEIVEQNKDIFLKMKNGISVSLKAVFNKNADSYGPSGEVRFFGNIIDGENRIIKSFDRENIIIKIGESKKLVYKEAGDQIIEFSILPEIL